MARAESGNRTTKRVAGAGAVLLLALATLGGASAQDPGTGDEMLRCQALPEGVLLEWDPIYWILPATDLIPIQGWLIARDGVPIAELPMEATGHLDADAPPGTHAYTLAAVNWNGEILLFGRCEVTVADPGLRCKVDGRMVRLEWGPILIDVWIEEFRVFRNKELIAILRNDVLSYVDTAPDVGAYRYDVIAVLGPDARMPIGSCEVAVRCFNLEFEVRGLEVDLAWTWVGSIDPPVGTDPPIGWYFAIQRDDERLAKTLEPKYTDTVPAPGTYLYRIWVASDVSEVPEVLIAACEVPVAGHELPPPMRLTCTVLDVSPEPIPVGAADGGTGIDTDGDGIPDSFPPTGVVVLQWVNPIPYETIVITRDRGIIATVPGDTTRFVDRCPAGSHVYGVRGTVGNLQSRPAVCEVHVEPGFLPPPQDFRCWVLDMLLDPNDPGAPVGSQEPGDTTTPFTVVALEWWNPVRYAGLVLVRDGALLAELPGHSMQYRDVAPPPGEHVYELWGFAANGERSPSVLCRVFVGPDPVPPVRDLQCLTPAISPEAIPEGSVLLLWRNAAAYDLIVILRNGAVAAELPGSEQRWLDAGLEPGIYRYEVIAVLGGRRSRPVACEVVIPGPQERNVLYFTPRMGADDPATEVPPPLPALPGNRLTCRAMNVRPLQGWSFGVASDPMFIVPTSVDLEDTATKALNGGAGPDFLLTEIVPDGSGVIMAVIIDTDGVLAGETLPPGPRHRLLNIAYGAGPSGTAGEAYPVKYSGMLGSPPVGVYYVIDGFEVVPATRPGWVSLPGTEFIRADANADGKLEMADALRIIAWLFLGGETLPCLEAADSNATGEVNIADPIWILQYLYVGGQPPPYPFPDCGTVPPRLGCERHEFCETSAGTP